MRSACPEQTPSAGADCADRIGVARLTKMAVAGTDLRPLWQDLIAKVVDGTAEAGEGLDLSLIAQLLGDKQAGLAIQHEILASHRLFRSPCAVPQPHLRVLALAAATDMGSNTPIEFLLQESAIELLTLYVIPDAELPAALPDHDVAIVIASDSEECREALHRIDRAAPHWPRPLLNPPRRVGNLDRDKLHRLLDGIEGLEIPVTIAVTRERLSEVSRSTAALGGIAADLAFPVIVRPRGSHAGAGLAKLDDRAAVGALSRDPAGTAILRLALCRLFRRRRPVSQVPDRLRRWPALRLPYGDRRSLGHLVSQRRNGGQRQQAARRRDLHPHLRHRLRAPPSGGAERPRRADRPGLFHGRLRRNQGRKAACFRGRQYRDRPRHGSARDVSLQAAADAQDIRRVRGHARSATQGAAGSARHDQGAARSPGGSPNPARRSIRRTGTSSAPRATACSTT